MESIQVEERHIRLGDLAWLKHEPAVIAAGIILHHRSIPVKTIRAR
jgi:hypothetical protein